MKTIGGNSNGSACVFPFKYKNIDHYQCTYEDSSRFDDKKWCCTTSDCDMSLKWGNCPCKKKEFKKNILFYFICLFLKAPSQQANNNCAKEDYISVDGGNNCYKAYPSDLKSWSDSRAQCKSDGGDLVSIRDGFEQAYVSLIKYSSSVNSQWIGVIYVI